jgi:hypothetical protein
MPEELKGRRYTEQPWLVSIASVTLLTGLPFALEVSDNMDFGELIVAVGTFALAMGTLALAWITRRLARSTKVSAEAAKESADAARESAKAERDSVEAMAMPYVIAMPVEGSQEIRRVHPGGGRGGMLRLRLWNLGSGPGIVTNICLTSHGTELLVALPWGIPLGADKQFNTRVVVADWPTSATIASLRIEYLHSNGRAYRTESDVAIDEGVLTCLTFRRSSAEEVGDISA